jgi:hypothetical protein
MGVLADVMDKLMFWRDDAPDGFENADIDGCFTLPGAEIGATTPAESSADTSDDESCG